MKNLMVILLILMTGCMTKPVEPIFKTENLNLDLNKIAKRIKVPAEEIYKYSKDDITKRNASTIIEQTEILLDKHAVYQKIKSVFIKNEARISELVSSKQKRVDDVFYIGISVGSFICACAMAMFAFSKFIKIPRLRGLSTQTLLLGLGIILLSSMAYYLLWIFTIGIGAIFTTFASYLIYKYIKSQKELTDKDNAESELVRTVDFIKSHFGTWDSEVKEKIDIIQSPKTQQIVSNARINNKLIPNEKGKVKKVK